VADGDGNVPGDDDTLSAVADRNDARQVSLSSYKVSTSIAVSDTAQAREFYEAKLGLLGVEDQHDGSRVYPCGGGTFLHVYPSPTRAGATTAILATRKVANLAAVVDQVRSHGVNFERHDEPQLETDERGIHTLGDGKVAWFKDADGNTFAVEQ
jgi:catechol 2,3-dioxygenase-like lactoylglutathione lyase family enzyme